LSPSLNTGSVQGGGISLPPIGASLNGSQVKPESGAVKGEPGIKQEPGTQQGIITPVQPYVAPAGNLTDPQARAAQLLHNSYGQRASASINALRNEPAQAGRPGIAQMPPQQRMQHATQAHGTNGLANAQTDGTGDVYEGILMQQDGHGNAAELGRLEIDRILHEKIASRAKQMEGGGLMLSLREATKHKTAGASKKSAAGASQMDGEDDLKLEDDSDNLIGSDLDDDEPNVDSEDEEGELAPIMLCMYDKVQRVKNKWYVLAYPQNPCCIC